MGERRLECSQKFRPVPVSAGICSACAKSNSSSAVIGVGFDCSRVFQLGNNAVAREPILTSTLRQ